ncbi:MAG: hypothetical protein IT462_14055 [Planctomycetes bacterium]|nr:hypothetical protein [Planctomycetota bacterium]
MDRLLQQVASRLRLARALRWALAAARISAPVAILAHFAFKLWPIWPQSWLLLPAGGLVPLVAFVLGWLRKPDRFAVSVTLDRALGLKEATSTLLATQALPDMPADVRAGLQSQAAAAASSVQPGALQAAFPYRGGLWLAAAVVLLLAAVGVGPVLPALIVIQPMIAQDAPEQRARELQQVRESARKLENQVADLERAAEQAKLEELRRAAADARKQLAELAMNPLPPREAMAQLSRLADKVRSQRDNLLGREPEMLGGNKTGSDDELSRIARTLDQLDPKGLSDNLEKYRDYMKAEAEKARAEGREPTLDRAELERMLKDAQDAERALKDLEEELKNNPGLQKDLEKLTRRQRELLEKISKELERLKAT